MSIPHLTTVLSGAILDLEKRKLDAMSTIEYWLRGQLQDYAVPFYRVHTGRGKNENLNAPGMHFVPLSFVPTRLLSDHETSTCFAPTRFCAYSVLARLTLLTVTLKLAQSADDAGESVSMTI